jgi:ATP-dependent DNA ligase
MGDKKTKVTKKIGRPPPDWLKNLPHGEYTAKELEKISGTLSRSVRKLMHHHNVVVEYKFDGKRVFAIYQWKGLE